MIRRLLAVSALSLLLPALAAAQTGPKVPPYQTPPPYRPGAGPEVDSNAPLPLPPPKGDIMRPREDIIARFREAYAQGGRPRLAFWWNRQLSDTLGQWYADSRTVTSDRTRNATEGDLSLKQTGGGQHVTETQRRAAESAGRPSRDEPWEWEFQDGFLNPFLKADATVVDRAMITRIMGAGAEDIEPKTVEVMAMQTMADLLVEVLVADSSQSTTGYELRARILDVKTGRILAMVNSRALPEWQRGGKAVATRHGFELTDEDDGTIGPERTDMRYRATPNGFQNSRRPPKVAVIAHNLATNVMDALLPRLEGGEMPVARTEPGAPLPLAPQPATALPSPPTDNPAAKPVPNDSAVPLPEVNSKPLPPPEKAAKAETPKVEEQKAGVGPQAEEPPMPHPTKN
jgi:hypothetical protein